MKYYYFIILNTMILSCQQKETDLTEFLIHSREQLVKMGNYAGTTERDKAYVEEYDLISKQVGTTDFLKSISRSYLLDSIQKSKLEDMFNNDTDGDVLRLALLSCYNATFHAYRFPIDISKIYFTSDGFVHVSFESSSISRWVSYATTRQDYESGNLQKVRFPYGSSDIKLPNLNHEDSVFGYFSFPYINGEYPKFEFRGRYDEKSR